MTPEKRIIRGPKIIEMLEQASTHRLRLQARVNEEPPSCETFIRTIYRHSNHMDIDVFLEPDRDQAMNQDVPVEVLMVINSTPYHFVAKCVGPNKGTVHTLCIPDEVEMIQRREYFRAEPPQDESLRVDVQYRPQDEMRAMEPINLSVGGVLIYDRMLAAAPEEDHPLVLQMRFDKGEELTTKGIVRRCSAHPNLPRGIQLGIKFERAGAANELKLNQIIMRWQRESRRRNLKKE